MNLTPKMRSIFFKKLLLAIIIFSLVFSSSGNIFFVKKAKAMSAGAGIGKAVGAAAACFAEEWIEQHITHLIAEAFGTATGLGKAAPALGFEAGAAADYFRNLITSVPVLDSAGFWSLKAINASNIAKLQSNEVQTFDDELSKSLVHSKDCLRDVLAKVLLDWIVDQVVEWIQGGGDPLFVSDWKGFLRDAANTAIGRVIQESDLAFLCSPFRAQLKISLLPVGRFFRDRIGCTLDDVVANIESFYEDFTRGGWIAYNRMWEPQNNYYGARLIVHDEMLTRAAEAQEAAKNEALAGSGFLSVKKCKTPDTELLNQCRDYWPDNPEMCPEKDFCREWEIQTPGSIVGEAAAKAVTSDIDWVNNIKSWVAAIINAAINRLIGEGLSLMSSSESYSGSGGNYDPYTLYNAAGRGEIATIINNYEILLRELKEVQLIKTETLSDVRKLIRNINCFIGFLTDEELKKKMQRYLTEAQEAEPRLVNEINQLNLMIPEATANQQEAQQVLVSSISSAEIDIQAVILRAKYEDFMRKYREPLSKVAKVEAAQVEADEIKQRLNEVRPICNTAAFITCCWP